ncbi:FAD-dependent oxidoreductase [Streptomyces caniscabiei]|uniref:NAD(P)/FAD-dependent oxidoreductase n=1 Tax=Streptomyces caniscabiei TaxID=2746961 RepID=UPI0029A6EDDF|nr:FAD-dependent oxidoreductase [Streptomyces caniscabiei]MDX2600338.1 FAD-dependent oxidoreductase [Streptomyces caniscabiei]
MTELQRLAVVGASLAGLRAVESARRSGFTGSVTLIGAEEHLPYNRPPLSKEYLAATPDGPPETTFRSEDTLRGELGVDLRLGAPATALDTEGRAVLVDGGAPVPYDALVIATGAVARVLPGTERLAGVHTLRTVDDAAAVRRALDEGARLVVVGAGFIGSEVASKARKRGLPVTLLEAADIPLRRALGDEMGLACAALHDRAGTDLRRGVAVRAIRRDGQGLRVELGDGSVLGADLVVSGVGADPAVSWLEGSGVELGDGVICDRTLATSVPGVYAAGDVAHWYNPLFEQSMRLEHWTSAAEQGAAAAFNALHPQEARPYSTVPYFWSDWYGTRIQFVGLSRADEVRVVTGDPADGRWVALYRTGDRLTGALAIDHPTHIMKYRMMIGRGCPWAEARDFARTRDEQAQPATTGS